MQLQEFIDLIAGHRSLQNTEILSAEGYRQKIVGIKEVSIVHRYLVLELKRHGQDPIWLRLDRRRDNDVGALAFLAAAAETRANDQVRGSFIMANVSPIVSTFLRPNLRRVKRI